MKIKCKQCKFDNNCEARDTAQWIEEEGRKGKKVTGCNLGKPIKENHAK